MSQPTSEPTCIDIVLDTMLHCKWVRRYTLGITTKHFRFELSYDLYCVGESAFGAIRPPKTVDGQHFGP